MPRIFLLSPANCSGPRAKVLLSERAAFDLALRLRSRQGVAIGEAFAFISGLYFRGKLAYALEFAQPPEPDLPLTASGALVITPNAGLRAVETAVTVEALRRFATVDIAANDPKYSKPLIASARTLAEGIGPSATSSCSAAWRRRSTSTSCVQIFGERLLFPIDFVGRGDMSRGGLLLRCGSRR